MHPSTCDPLAAFCGAEEASFPSVEMLFAHAERLAHTLPATVVEVLRGEIDVPQAEMFARRFLAVSRLLTTSHVPQARLLHTGLVMRLAEVLEAPSPRALRVRAVADFFYSQAALLRHQNPHAPPLQQLVQQVMWRTVAPGMQHAKIQGNTQQGPVHINVLRMHARLETLDCRGMGSLGQIVAQCGADAGISGGFFLYSEPDIHPPSRRTDPVGLLVHRGQVKMPPVWRRSALWQDAAGAQHLTAIGLPGCRLHWPNGEYCTIEAVNEPDHHGVVAFTRAGFDRSPPRRGVAMSVVGSTPVSRGTGSLPIPLAGVVITAPTLPSGPPSHWSVSHDITEGIAGGPRLLDGGRIDVQLAPEEFTHTAPPITFSKDETFDQNLLPRMAIGQCPDGALVAVAIDGRNIDQAPGMTLRQTASLCKMLGCTDAINLDGGSSKRMAVGPHIVDLPSTEVIAGTAQPARVRPVNTAVLFFHNRQPGRGQ